MRLRLQLFQFQEKLLENFQNESVRLAEWYVDSYRKQTKQMYQTLLREEKRMYNESSKEFKQSLETTIEKFRQKLKKENTLLNLDWQQKMIMIYDFIIIYESILSVSWFDFEEIIHTPIFSIGIQCDRLISKHLNYRNGNFQVYDWCWSTTN